MTSAIYAARKILRFPNVSTGTAVASFRINVWGWGQGVGSSYTDHAGVQFTTHCEIYVTPSNPPLTNSEDSN
jgi:hypothetical protein